MITLRSLFGKFVRRLRDFGRSESGMTLPLLAVSMVMITGMVGIAIDTARAQLVQSKLQFSLDSAGLAGGSTVSTANLQTEVTKYLNANFNGYLGSTVTNTSVTTNANNTVITLMATATLPTTFMNALNIPTMTVTANSQISRAVTGLELVLVLDNTGSMTDSAGGSQSKIQALQTASTTLVTTLFSSSPPAGKLWIGIVPFSQAVNIGTSHSTWMNTTYDNSISGMPLSQGPGWGTTSWGGCVDARQSGYDITDDPPSTTTTATLFEQYYWPSDNLTYGSPFNNTPNSNYNDWATAVKARHSSTITGYTYASPLDTTHQGPNMLCPQQVTPMTNVQGTLTSAISSMTAQGDTLIGEGLAWGWRMLSPRWQGMWGGTMNANGLPLAYNTPGMAKAVVLLTDGYNTIDNLAHGAYWFLENDRTGSTSSTTAVNDLDAKTLSVCNAMKAQGIYIYTIALGTDTDAAALSLLQSCATAPNYYFNSPSTSTLQSVFNTIGDSLSNLRVSQ